MNPDIFPIVSADSACIALLGMAPCRLFPFSEAPEKAVYPYATYGVVAGVPQNLLDRPPQIDQLGTQVDIWAKTSESCLDTAAAIRDAIERHAHMTSIGGMDRDIETKSFHIRLEFDFFKGR